MSVNTLISEENYLSLEEASQDRHEYVDGVLRLMAGTTEEHNLVVQNFVLKLAMVAREKRCRLVTESVRLRLPLASKRRYYYPDVVVSCGVKHDPHMIEETCLIVEVLSPSTESTDRVEKLEMYQRMASLRQYILVEPAKAKVEVYTRDEKGWRYQLIEKGDFEVICLNTVMTLEDVYAGIIWL